MPNDQPTHRFRLRFTVKQLFLAVAVVAIGLAIWNWLFRKEVMVRASTAEDKVFGDERLKSRRDFAVVKGSVTKRTSLLVSSHLLQAGKAEQSRPAGVFGREESRDTKGPLREDVALRLSFVGRAISAREVAFLLLTWTEKGGSKEWRSFVKSIHGTINGVVTKTVPGKITPGRPHIVYVEGDQAIVIDGSMTVEEFAKANPGNYLLVTVEVK